MKEKLTIILLLVFGLVQAQFIESVTTPDTSIQKIMDEKDPAYTTSMTITKEDLIKHLTILASDEFQGRETGTPGNDLASAYIAGELERMGIEPLQGDSYFQKVDFKWISWDEISIHVGESRFKHLWDFLAFPDQNMDLGKIDVDEVIFMGYGIDDPKYTDYKRADIEGKVIMINEGEPMDEDGKYLISGDTGESEWSQYPDKKLELAYEKGAKVVLIITKDIQKMLAENRSKLLGPTVIIGQQEDSQTKKANSIYISSNIAKEIIGNKEKKMLRARKRIAKGKFKRVKLKTDMELVQKRSDYELAGNNILAYIEGTDKKDEVLIVSAHYDHVGMRGDDVFNGADDNGSGSTTVLELAEAFQIAKENGNGPRRSILFLWLTGEEKGLLGSEYYTEYPVFPLEKTIADINIDMVGRVDEKYEDYPNYIYVIGSDRISQDLHNVNEEVNQLYTQLTLDYTYNSEEDPNRFYYRSDHYNFAKNGIPSIFFFNGVHEDYHKTTDTVEKINFDKMTQVARHIFQLAWRLSNQDADLRITNGKA
ncbi:M28 family peptidase [Portibacter marinus]|uniref:M28 family peptidase n=1 Tax=Portibacter marinus TaxID=2898660 RepID=UPI001F25F486|nr:M28 family peptidase [Portibacter marinus]